MKNTLLSYNTPAEVWTDALPLGNGRLGTMAYGRISREKLQFNEETLWSGWETNEGDNPDCAAHLNEMRSLIFAGKFTEAEEMAKIYMRCRSEGSRSEAYGSYQTAGQLYIALSHDGTVENYRRTLDISTGCASVTYEKDGVHYERTYFVSPEPNAVCGRIKADSVFTADITYVRENASIAYTACEKGGSICVTGNLSSGHGIDYAVTLRFTADGNVTATDSALHFEGKELTFAVSIATTYQGCGSVGAASPDSGNVAEKTETAVKAALSVPFGTLQKQTAEHFYRLLSRCTVDIGADDYYSLPDSLPVNERLDKLHEGKPDEAGLDALTELYFQFGRYLMISSSYHCVLPANLQGIWTNDYKTIWSADYHININIQMNYWLTEVTNLPECGDIFLNYIRFLSGYGKHTAEVSYRCGGWTAHTVTNPWGFTAAGEGCSWGSFMCAGAWCCAHLWERWLYSHNLDELRDNYPIMRGACEFFLDFLCEDPNTGYLVTAPSNSPENHYTDPNTGKVCSICAGPTMDNSILYELFTNTVEAASILGIDEDFAETVRHTRDRLPPIRIGKHGQIMEWQEDYEEPEPGHRHLSMLYGLHPSSLITQSKTPDLFDAAKVSIARRLSSGGGHTGWSRAWIINFYARLFMGDECQKHITALLTKSTYPNLFDSHPPFQIDGNFGGCAGIAEMLLQSHEGFIRLLPALPTAWKNGSFRGLRTRGGFLVSAEWKDGKPTGFTVTAELGGDCEIRFAESVWKFALKKGETKTVSLL